ncbi:MAG: hypothetical protein KDC35_20815 [Acidobacteria bacterium]|nr:hypothetical protein [Acidobacteriota bacterium]
MNKGSVGLVLASLLVMPGQVVFAQESSGYVAYAGPERITHVAFNGQDLVWSEYSDSHTTIWMKTLGDREPAAKIKVRVLSNATFTGFVKSDNTLAMQYLTDQGFFRQAIGKAGLEPEVMAGRRSFQSFADGTRALTQEKHPQEEREPEFVLLLETQEGAATPSLKRSSFPGRDSQSQPDQIRLSMGKAGKLLAVYNPFEPTTIFLIDSAGHTASRVGVHQWEALSTEEKRLTTLFPTIYDVVVSESTGMAFVCDGRRKKVHIHELHGKYLAAIDTGNIPFSCDIQEHMLAVAVSGTGIVMFNLDDLNLDPKYLPQ